MPKKKRLDIDREAVRARMEAGEEMDSFAVWKSTKTGTYQWAYATLSRWHKAKLIHVCKWIRREYGGMPRPVFAWGNKEDAERPNPLSKIERERRYMEKLRADPLRWQTHCARRSVLERTTPILDPIHATMLGYVRCRGVWIKPSKAANEKPAHPDQPAA